MRHVKKAQICSHGPHICAGETGLAAATGYGLVTHAYNLAHGLVPTGAVTLCTIGDYIAMKLCGRQTPVMDASNAAGLGFFGADKRAFNQTVLRGIGIDPAFLPGLTEDRFIGICRSRARVAAAIGDNQASFLRQFGIASAKCS